MRQNNPMRLSAFFLVLISVLLAAFGCKMAGGHQPGGVPPPKLYKTAVSLSPSASEILGAKAYNVTIIGKTERCNYPISNASTPIVMKGVKPNYELITKLHPDLIVYEEDLFSKADIDKLDGLGIDTYAFKGNTIEEFVDCLYRFASKVHAESNISEYIDLIQSAINASSGDPLPKPLKVAVLMPGEGSDHMIAGKNAFVSDVVRKAGGDPVGPDAKLFVALNAESLVSLNPDFIVSTGKADSIRKDPRLQSLTAIRKNGILEADPDQLLRKGARIDKVIRKLHEYFMIAAQGGPAPK